jgi:arylsulfatase A-like enzyme
MWGPALTSWREGGWKLVREPGRDRLFHVAEDPAERRDRAADSPAELERLAEGLSRALAGFRALASGSQVAIDGELLEWMQQMGYAGGDER